MATELILNDLSTLFLYLEQYLFGNKFLFSAALIILLLYLCIMSRLDFELSILILLPALVGMISQQYLPQLAWLIIIGFSIILWFVFALSFTGTKS